MRLFTRQQPELTLGGAAAATGISRATARRFLLTLAGLSCVRADGQGFRPAPGMPWPGYAYLSSHRFVWAAQAPPERPGRGGEGGGIGVGARSRRRGLRRARPRGASGLARHAAPQRGRRAGFQF